MSKEAENKEGLRAACGSVVRMHVNYYSAGIRTHGHDESCEKLALYCPNCGEKQVWHEMSEGDYYVGELYLCISCRHGFYLPVGVRSELDNEQGKQRLDALGANPSNIAKVMP